MKEYKIIPYNKLTGEPMSLNYIKATNLDEALAKANELLPKREIDSCFLDTYPPQNREVKELYNKWN